MKATVAATAVLALIYLFSTAAVSAQAGASFSTCCISGFAGWIKLPTEECKPIKCPTWSYFDPLNPREEALSESEADSELLLPFLPPHISEGVKERVNLAAKNLKENYWDDFFKHLDFFDDSDETAVAATAPLKKKRAFGGGRKFLLNQRRRPQGAWGRRSSAPRRFVRKDRARPAPTKSLSEGGPVCGRSGCRG